MQLGRLRRRAREHAGVGAVPEPAQGPGHGEDGGAALPLRGELPARVPRGTGGEEVTDTISDEVLKQIAEGTGRTYPHEGKQVARELIEFRKLRNDAKLTLANAP